jgi:hypothetical protein
MITAITALFFLYCIGLFLLTISLIVRVFDKDFKDKKEMRKFLKGIILWPIALYKIILDYFNGLPSGEE